MVATNLWEKGDIDVDKIDSDKTSLEDKVNNGRFIKMLALKTRTMYRNRFKWNYEKNKNDMMYLFLVLDNKENIVLLQQFEVNYLKRKANDILDALRYIENGVSVKTIERQLNVKYSFINHLLDKGIIDFIIQYKREKNTNRTYKGKRFTETNELLKEYKDNKLDIIGYIRDGYTVKSALDEVGSIYNTREWMTFTNILENEGYDLRGSYKVEDTIYLKLEGYLEEDIEVELGFDNEVEEELKSIINNLDYSLDINSITDEEVKKYINKKESNTLENYPIPENIEDVKKDIEHLVGNQLLNYLGKYLRKYGDLEGLI